MNELNVNYEDHKNKWIYCVKAENTFGIRKGKGYKIIKVNEKNGSYFYDIMTEKYPNGIGFNSNSKSFLSVEDSQAKLRQLKFERIIGGTEDQTYLTD